MVPSAEAEAEQIARLKAWRAARDEARVARGAAGSARGGGERRQHHARLDRGGQGGRHDGRMGRRACAPSSANIARRPASRRARGRRRATSTRCATEVERVSLKLGRRMKFLVGKPGLDGHSNGAEQIAARATDAGMDVVYDGIRFTPDEIVERAKAGVHCVGLSILSGSHVALTDEVLKLCARRASAHPGRRRRHHSARRRGAAAAAGVAAVYTPEGFRDQRHHRRIVREVEARFDEQTAGAGALPKAPDTTKA